MKFRVARHSHDLDKIKHFYCDLIGLKVLGSFSDHDDYSGVFIGKEEENWHLEFTVSSENPLHHSDEDDLLVFYTQHDKEYQSILSRFREKGIKSLKAKNSYWSSHGTYFKDPDGFGIIIAK